MTTKFNQLLRQLRENRDLTQAELGLRSGMDGAAVRRLENSETHPQFITVLRLIAGLGMSLNDEEALRLRIAAGYSDKFGQIGDAMIESGATIEEAYLAQYHWAGVLFEWALGEFVYFANFHESELPEVVQEDYHSISMSISALYPSLRHFFWLLKMPVEERKIKRRWQRMSR